MVVGQRVTDSETAMLLTDGDRSRSDGGTPTTPDGVGLVRMLHVMSKSLTLWTLLVCGLRSKPTTGSYREVKDLV